MLGLRLAQWILELGLAAGAGCWIAIAVLACVFKRHHAPDVDAAALPPTSLLKPIYGLEKGLRDNLRSACEQDYPDYEVICSVQRAGDPALPLLRELEATGQERLRVVTHEVVIGSNGKVNNLAGALPHARHDVIVISDSDARLAPDFLRQVVAPLADPSVGAVTTFFRAINGERWFEKLELLALNVDQFAAALLAKATGVSFCFGVSTALTKDTLARIGGFPALANYLVEDTEMGRRIIELGKRVVVAPHVVDVGVDLPSFRDYGRKQVYWDHNTLAASPRLYAASFLLRIVPLALLTACARGWDATGLSLVMAALALRWLSAALVLGVALRDTAGLRALWLLPVKDLLSVVWSIRALTSRTLDWRGVTLAVDGQRQLRTAPLAAERRG